MKLTGSSTALLALIASLMLSGACSAEDPAARNCTWCHGSSAQGYTPAPRLAGQRRAYLEQQLASFKSHTRDNPESKQYMWGAAANLDAQLARDLAAYFATLPPRAAADGRAELVATGRAIYQTGAPEANIVAASSAMGPMAKALRPFRASAASLTSI